MDVMPSHINELSFTPREPGDYYGECAEFCGVSHAWMRFEIDVVEEDQFDAWVQAWNTPPTFDGDPSTTDVAEVPTVFGQCILCHSVNGTNAMAAQEGLSANPLGLGAGPNLTLFGCRDIVAAGLLVNTPENLYTWLDRPGEVKEGNYMSSVIKDDTLTPEQINELVAYLSSLQPEGGCPEDGGAPLGTPVAVGGGA
ncbi:MAG: c-type cytochrome, partial [Chloroflexota bacterium]|nr:c-type cytochrome [Chloroflexota bacterium]